MAEQLWSMAKSVVMDGNEETKHELKGNRSMQASHGVLSFALIVHLLALSFTYPGLADCLEWDDDSS